MRRTTRPSLRLPSTASRLATLLAWLALALAALGAPQPVRAQEDAARPAPPAAGPQPERELERTIYIPYKDLEKVFEKDGRGVFLPYEEFMRLWRSAGGGARDHDAPAPPPVDWAVAAADLDGSVEADVATLKVALDVQVLRKGWASVPLPFARAAIRDVSLKDDRAVLAPAEGGQGWRLIAPGPKAYRVELTLVAPIASRPGVRSLSIGLPSAAVSRLKLRLPEKGIKVEVSPNLAATTKDGEGDTTELLAFLGASSEVKVEWNPRPKEVDEGKPLVFVESRTLLRVEDGVARSDSTLRWQVVQGSVGELSIALPEGYTLVRLEGKLVRDFTVEGRTAKVRLHQRARERFDVELGLERALPEAGGRIAAPVFDAQGVDRETGTVAIAPADGLAAKVVVQEGVSRVDPPELEERDRAARPIAAFRFLKLPWRLEAEVSRIEPEIDLSTWSLLSIGEEAATFRAILSFDIQRAGVFGWRMTIPRGWQPLEVGVVGDARASGALVKDFRVVEAGELQRLEVDLPGRTLGAHRLELLLSRRRASRTEAVELPRIAVEGVRRESGLLAVAVAASLEAATSKSDGLRPVAAAEAASQGLVPQRRLGEPDAELRLAFRYARPPYAASFDLKPRRPVVSAQVEELVTIADDVQKVEAQIGFTILYAAIRELRLAVPSEIADQIEIEGPGIQEKRREDAPAAATGTPAPAEARFRILLQTDTLGSYALRVSWKRKLGELKSGGSADVALGAVRVQDVFNETGFIAVQKGDDLVIEPEAQNLEPVDARELPPSLRDRGGISRSYRYLAHPYSLAFKVQKHEFAPVLDTHIDAERVEAVVTKERVARCEATLEVQNNRRQFLEVRLPDESDLLAVYVDGALVRPAVGDRKEVVLISLPKGRTGGNPIRVTLRYDTPLGGGGTLGATDRLAVSGPTFPAGAATIPVARSRLDLYLPIDMKHLAFESRMQKRFDDRRLLHSILAWVAAEPAEWPGDADFARPAGAVGGDALDVKLVREGRLYVFTALEAASGASVRLMSPALFYGLVGVFLVLGLLGARRGAQVFGAATAVPAAAVALFGLGAFAGETLGSCLDAALAGTLAAGALSALRFAFIDAPRARSAAAAARVAELNAAADRSAIEKLKRQVADLRGKVEKPAAPPPSGSPAASGRAPATPAPETSPPASATEAKPAPGGAPEGGATPPEEKKP